MHDTRNTAILVGLLLAGLINVVLACRQRPARLKWRISSVLSLGVLSWAWTSLLDHHWERRTLLSFGPHHGVTLSDLIMIPLLCVAVTGLLRPVHRLAGAVAMAMSLVVSAFVLPPNVGRDYSRWDGSFAGGDLSRWDSVQRARADAIRVVPVTGPSGTTVRAARFEVRAGDHVYSARSESAELGANSFTLHAAEGRRQVLTWSVLFPKQTPLVPGSSLVFTILKSKRLCERPIAFALEGRTEGPELVLHLRGGTLANSSCPRVSDQVLDLGPARYDTWTALRLEVTWSSSSATGSIAVNVGGRNVLPIRRLPTWRGPVYLLQGLYREAGPASPAQLLLLGTHRQDR